MIPRYVARAIRAWQQWRFEHGRANRARSLRTAVPALAVLDQQRAEKRRRHAPGARQIDMRKRALVTERLRMELTRG